MIPIGCSQDTETSSEEKEVNESENKEDNDIQKRIDYLRDGLKEAQVLYDNGIWKMRGMLSLQQLTHRQMKNKRN